MGLKRFTKPKFLEQIGRPLLGRLLEQYGPEFARDSVVLPATMLPDKEYYAALAKLMLARKGLPEIFIEALYSVEAMANEEAKARLLRAAEQSGLEIERVEQSTCADFAVQVMLAAPALFAQKHNETRIVGLSSFEYYGCTDPVDRRTTFRALEAEQLAFIKGDIDTWLTSEREGTERATEIDMHEVDEEFWFLIRRGDAFARMPVVEDGIFTVRHLRPARDLVVVYSPERDELRIHGKTSGEKRMIRQTFGQRFFGNPEYFSVRQTFTLEPLRVDGPDALAVRAGGGIDRVVLKELEVRTDDEHDAVLIWKANDLFAYAQSCGQQAIPTRGRLVKAGFEVYFTGSTKPRMVYLRAGNNLRLTRHCDGPAVHRWISENGYRAPEKPGVNRAAA